MVVAVIIILVTRLTKYLKPHFTEENYLAKTIWLLTIKVTFEEHEWSSKGGLSNWSLINVMTFMTWRPLVWLTFSCFHFSVQKHFWLLSASATADADDHYQHDQHDHHYQHDQHDHHYQHYQHDQHDNQDNLNPSPLLPCPLWKTAVCTVICKLRRASSPLCSFTSGLSWWLWWSWMWWWSANSYEPHHPCAHLHYRVYHDGGSGRDDCDKNTTIFTS